MNPFEGIRVVAAVVLVVLSCWGYIVAQDGLYAYHVAIRKKILQRRRALMVMFLSWGIALGSQGFISALSPDVRPMDSISISINTLYLYLILSMIVAVTVQFIGWMHFQDIIGNRPLVPETDARVQQMVVDGRTVCHGIANSLQDLIGSLDLLRAEGGISDELKLDIEAIYNQALALRQSTGAVHQIVKEIGNVRSSNNYISKAKEVKEEETRTNSSVYDSNKENID